ncbi:MAG: DUF4169 family protein [Pseudomonadota bacterium]
MSSNVVNLNRIRKAKARQEKEARAAENRRVHGRTKAEKNSAKHEADKSSKALDGHKRETDDSVT